MENVKYGTLVTISHLFNKLHTSQMTIYEI